MEENRIICKQFNNTEGNSPVTLLKIEGDQKEKFLNILNVDALEKEGSYKKGSKVSSFDMLPLISAAGFSFVPNDLYIATEDPSDLMRIGEGVGSPIVNAGKIVGHASFVKFPTSSIYTHLIALQVITSISIQNNFKVVNEKLDSIKNDLIRMKTENNAEVIGRLESAKKIINSIEEQYAVNNDFTNDMKQRLNPLEHDIGSIFEKYESLYDKQKLDKESNKDDINTKILYANIYLFASFLDIKISFLRKMFDAQENLRRKRHRRLFAFLRKMFDAKEYPEYIDIADIKQKIKHCEDALEKICKIPNELDFVNENKIDHCPSIFVEILSIPVFLFTKGKTRLISSLLAGFVSFSFRQGEKREKKRLKSNKRYLLEQGKKVSEKCKMMKKEIEEIKKALNSTIYHIYFRKKTYVLTSDIQFKEPSK